MSIDAWTLEKAAFACFGNKLEDNYKRLLFIHISKTVEQHPNISANKCYGLVNSLMPVERIDFDSAVRAMVTPFKRLALNSYTRKAGGASAMKPQPSGSDKGMQVTHLRPMQSDSWDSWVKAVIDTYPELHIWFDE